MDIAPPTVYFCPACKKPVAEMNLFSYSVQTNNVYSDGVRTERAGPFTPHFTPSLAKCPFCREIFFLNNLKPTTKIISNKKFKYLESPEKNDYIRAVKQGLSKTNDEEIEARSCLWHALNDIIRHNRKQNDRNSDEENDFLESENGRLWEANCKALLSLLELKVTGVKDKNIGKVKKEEITITIAELYRNLGSFETCVKILEDLPETYEWLKQKYLFRTSICDRMVFTLISSEDKNEENKTERTDIEDPDKVIEFYTNEIQKRDSSLSLYYSFRSKAYFSKGDFNNALSDINAALLEKSSRDYYLLRAKIYNEMGNTDNAAWNRFKANHAAAFDYEMSQEHKNNPKSLKDSINDEDEKPIISQEKVTIQKNNGNIILCISMQEGDPLEPEILYSGGDNALFRRRPDQFILLKKVPQEFFNDTDVREAIFNKKEVTIAEKHYKSQPHEYAAKILLVFEKLDSIESVIKDGYPIFTSLRARVSANMNRIITDIIGKEDCANLLAVLAREENYPILNKYLTEKLPVNDRVSSVFGTWRPTPLYYVTTKKLVGFMEDPLKMIRFLAANGASPDMACEEGDTPLGNQCLNNGLPIIMKTLLEAGADPNRLTDTGEIKIMPLHLTLLPSEYDEETHEFTPIKAKEIEKIKLLVDHNADVNYKSDTGTTPLSLAINNSEGDVRISIIKILLDKGADVQEAIDALEKAAEMESHFAAYALYEIFSGQIDILPVKADSKQARKYLCLAADLKDKAASTEDGTYDKGKYH